MIVTHRFSLQQHLCPSFFLCDVFACQLICSTGFILPTSCNLLPVTDGRNKETDSEWWLRWPALFFILCFVCWQPSFSALRRLLSLNWKCLKAEKVIAEGRCAICLSDLLNVAQNVIKVCISSNILHNAKALTPERLQGLFLCGCV